MSKTKNTITVKQIKDIAHELSNRIPDRKITYSIGGENIDIGVKSKLTVYEMLNLVDSVCTSVVDGVDGNYRPEMKDYFLRLAVIDAYTNISLPKGIEDCYSLVYGTDIFERITASEENPTMWYAQDYADAVINMAQYKAMIEAIDNKIEYMEAKTLKHSKMDDVMDSLETMLKDSSANLNDVNIKEFVNKISSMTKVDEKALAEALINVKYSDPNKVVNFPETKAKSDEEE